MGRTMTRFRRTVPPILHTIARFRCTEWARRRTGALVGEDALLVLSDRAAGPHDFGFADGATPPAKADEKFLSRPPGLC
jgi:hypothetical protein